MNRLRSCPDFHHVSIQIMEGNSDKAIESVRQTLNEVLTGIQQTNGKGGLGVLILLPRVRLETAMQNVPGIRILPQHILKKTSWKSMPGILPLCITRHGLVMED